MKTKLLMTSLLFLIPALGGYGASEEGSAETGTSDETSTAPAPNEATDPGTIESFALPGRNIFPEGVLLSDVVNVGKGMQTGSTESSQPGQKTKPSMRDKELVEDLRAGGHVILFRHAAPEDTSTNHTFSSKDGSQETEIGEPFEEIGIPIGRVFSSPSAKSKSELMFGDEKVETTEALGPSFRQERAGTQVETPDTELQQMLATQPREGTNTLLTIQTAPGQKELNNELIVFKPLGEGSFQRVAIMTTEQWTGLARSQG